MVGYMTLSNEAFEDSLQVLETLNEVIRDLHGLSLCLQSACASAEEGSVIDADEVSVFHDMAYSAYEALTKCYSSIQDNNMNRG